MFECKAQADEKTEHTNVCEYFEEACNTAFKYPNVYSFHHILNDEEKSFKYKACKFVIHEAYFLYVEWMMNAAQRSSWTFCFVI